VGTWVNDPIDKSTSTNKVMLFFFEDGTGVYETLIGAKVKSLYEFRYRINHQSRFLETIEKNGKIVTVEILELSNEYLVLQEFYGHTNLKLKRNPG